MDLTLDLDDVKVPATLDLPATPVRGNLVVLHGAEAPQRSFFLYEHLAMVMPRLGVAVLRYDRRPSPSGDDIPFEQQAADAITALRWMRAETGGAAAGVWGVSQGGWAAPFTAARYPREVDFVIAVSAAGVSPAQQMRYATERQLRLHGFGEREVAELLRVRCAVEEFLRGAADRDNAQRLVDSIAGEPWFQHAYLPQDLPPAAGAWTDMDFDPSPIFAGVGCPVLAVYGETDAWVPIEDSIACWQRATQTSRAEIQIVRVPGCDHMPSFGERMEVEAISDTYTAALIDWLDRTLPRP